MLLILATVKRLKGVPQMLLSNNLLPMYSKTLVVAALLGSICIVQGVPLKTKLAQTAQDCDLNAQAAALDDVTVAEPELDWCPCNATELPGLGTGVQASNSLHAQVLQSTSVSSTPDVEQSTDCLT